MRASSLEEKIKERLKLTPNTAVYFSAEGDASEKLSEKYFLKAKLCKKEKPDDYLDLEFEKLLSVEQFKNLITNAPVKFRAFHVKFHCDQERFERLSEYYSNAYTHFSMTSSPP